MLKVHTPNWLNHRKSNDFKAHFQMDQNNFFEITWLLIDESDVNFYLKQLLGVLEAHICTSFYQSFLSKFGLPESLAFSQCLKEEKSLLFWKLSDLFIMFVCNKKFLHTEDTLFMLPLKPLKSLSWVFSKSYGTCFT